MIDKVREVIEKYDENNKERILRILSFIHYVVSNNDDVKKVSEEQFSEYFSVPSLYLYKRYGADLVDTCMEEYIQLDDDKKSEYVKKCMKDDEARKIATLMSINLISRIEAELYGIFISYMRYMNRIEKFKKEFGLDFIKEYLETIGIEIIEK